MKYKAEKLIETKEEGEFEIRRFKIKWVELDEEKLSDLWEDESDDYEGAFYHGLIGSFDEDLIIIDVTKFLDYIEELLDEEDEGEDEEDGDSVARYFVNKLNNLRGYTIDLQEKK